MNEFNNLKSKKKDLSKAVKMGWIITIVIILGVTLFVFLSWNSYYSRQKALIAYLNSTNLNFGDSFSSNEGIAEKTYLEQIRFYLLELGLDYTYDELYDALLEQYEKNADYSYDAGSEVEAAKARAVDALVKYNLKERVKKL